MHDRMSAVIKTMATTVLARPNLPPSSEAAHAALLLAHVAWNRANGIESIEAQYRPVLDELVRANPDLWGELRTTDCEAMIGALIAYKQKRHPGDFRHIVVCGMRDGNVHVEWVDPMQSPSPS